MYDGWVYEWAGTTVPYASRSGAPVLYIRKSRIRGVLQGNASSGSGSGGRGEGAHRLHSIEAEARSAVPDRGGGSAHRVAIGAEAAAGGADQGDREARSYEATNFRVRSLPFGSEAGG